MKALTEQLGRGLMLILVPLGIMWVVELINLPFGHGISRSLGIIPRDVSGLPGILLSPFLHFGLLHIGANTLPFAVLGGLVSVQGPRRFVLVSLIIMLVSGTAVWLLARNGAHAGASGLIFGYFGYLLAAGWYARSIGSLLIALAVAFFYGGMIFGVVPLRAYVSWEGHLFGLLAGVLTAWLLHRRANKTA